MEPTRDTGSAGRPKILLMASVPWDSAEIHAEIIVFLEVGGKMDDASRKTFSRLAGLRGDAAEERVQATVRPYLEALKKIGPGFTYDDLVRLGDEWVAGRLDMH